MTQPDPAVPHADDDTFEVIDDALTALAERRGVWLGDDLKMIGLLASLIDQAARCLPHIIISARANGHSWAEIARPLGTNPAEAQLRFDPDSPIADTRWPFDT